MSFIALGLHVSSGAQPEPGARGHEAPVTGGAIGSMHGPTLFRLVFGALSGAITGAILGVLIGGAEIFLPQTGLGQVHDRAPFVVAFAAKWILYSDAIVLVLGSMVGEHVASVLLISPQSAYALDAQRMTAPAAARASRSGGTSSAASSHGAPRAGTSS